MIHVVWRAGLSCWIATVGAIPTVDTKWDDVEMGLTADEVTQSAWLRWGSLPVLTFPRGAE